MDEPRVAAVVLAAGGGERIAGPTNKVLLPIGGRPMLTWSLELFERLRDVYLEPWGAGLVDTFELALRVGTFARAFGWLRVYDTIAPGKQRDEFFQWFPTILRRAVANAG